MDTETSTASRGGRLGAFVTAQTLGISIVVMMSVWLSKYLGGFAWDGTGRQFNAHPLSMTLGMLYLYGTATMVYRVFPNTRKIKLKILHAGLLLLAFVGAVVGLVAVFEFHNAQNIANLYSLHSWCGLITVILFFLQYLVGFVSFLFPGLNNERRACCLPIHRYFGVAILSFAGITAISGINEKLFFLQNYQSLHPSAILGNVIGVVIVAFICTVLFIVQKPTWQRSTLINIENEGSDDLI